MQYDIRVNFTLYTRIWYTESTLKFKIINRTYNRSSLKFKRDHCWRAMTKIRKVQLYLTDISTIRIRKIMIFVPTSVERARKKSKTFPIIHTIHVISNGNLLMSKKSYESLIYLPRIKYKTSFQLYFNKKINK